MKLIINRISQDKTQSIGELLVIGSGDIHRFTCVEPPWKNNEVSVSCIPAGKYQAEKTQTHRLGNVIRILGVDGRTGILIHAGNFHHQLEGCIAPGSGFKDLDSDGHVDVINSRDTMNFLWDIVPDEFTVEINNAPQCA